MRDIIYLVTEQSGQEFAWLFDSWGDVYERLERPGVKPLACLTINHTHGRTYHERKANAHNLAVQFSNNQTGGLSWGEVAEVRDSFEKIGRRCGLLREFRANGII